MAIPTLYWMLECTECGTRFVVHDEYLKFVGNSEPNPGLGAGYGGPPLPERYTCARGCSRRLKVIGSIFDPEDKEMWLHAPHVPVWMTGALMNEWRQLIDPSKTPEDIRRRFASNGFANLLGGTIVHVRKQEQLNRAFVCACERGYLDLPKQLHSEGAEIRGSPEPLRAAAEFDQLQVAEYLVENGADIDAPARQRGQTPLMDAAGSASVRVVRYLLQLGADGSLVCDYGKTALDWAEMSLKSVLLPEMQTENDVLNDYDRIIQLLRPRPNVG